jgi:hypothetical protein
MKTKFIVTGALLGAIVGLLLSLLFPSLLSTGLDFNQKFNSQIGIPANSFSLKGGSVLNIIMVIPLFFGLIGGLFGYITFVLKSLHGRE